MQTTANPSPSIAPLLAEAKKKFSTESRSMYAWPVQLDLATQIGLARNRMQSSRADLWVMGHKGRMNNASSTPKGQEAERPTTPEPAGIKTFAASQVQAPEATSAALDALAAGFVQPPGADTLAPSGVAMPPPAPASASVLLLEHPVLECKRIPALREDPVNPVIEHRHKPKVRP